MAQWASWRRRLFQNALDRQHPLRSLSRWPRWLLAIATGRPTIVRFATGGLRMRLVPKLHSFGSTSLFIKRDRYEPELLAMQRLVRPGAVALDIGASFGVFSLFIAHFVGPHGRVHAFEPGAFSFAQLSANVAANPVAERIVLHKLAAADCEAELTLQYWGGAPVTFGIAADEAGGGEQVRSSRVADIVPPEDAARLELIKIDVEGFEITALEGARELIAARLPTIMFEVEGAALARQGRVPADVYGFLAGFGYRFWKLDERARFVPVAGTPEGNIFAAISDLSDV